MKKLGKKRNRNIHQKRLKEKLGSSNKRNININKSSNELNENSQKNKIQDYSNNNKSIRKESSENLMNKCHLCKNIQEEPSFYKTCSNPRCQRIFCIDCIAILNIVNIFNNI